MWEGAEREEVPQNQQNSFEIWLFGEKKFPEKNALEKEV